jgi:acetyl esterase/lipase
MCYSGRILALSIIVLIVLITTAPLDAQEDLAATENADPQLAKTTCVYKQVDACEIKADVYRLPGDDIRPALVWIHGGALIGGDRELVAIGALKEYLQRYLEAGFVVISIDYRLAPETKLPQIIEDLQDAFRWVREKGPDAFRIDPHRIAVVGGSAGGYLTLMAGYCVHPRPQCLVSFYGYGDIVGKWYSQPDAFYLTFPAVSKEEAFAGVGDKPLSGCSFFSAQGQNRNRFYLYCRQNGLWCNEVAGLDPIRDLEKLVPFCPVRNVTREYPPTMLLHGDKDTDVPHEQSIMMAEELARHGVTHELRILTGQGHGFEGVEKNDEWTKNNDPQVLAALDAVLVFLQKHVGTR